KFGSIARSVNIHIDKLGRDARSAKKDLDQLLGPAPEGSLGTIDLLATALPTARPGGPAPAVPPPPSEFRFSDSGAQPARPQVPPRTGTPPPFRAAAPPVGPRAPARAVAPPLPVAPPERFAERSGADGEPYGSMTRGRPGADAEPYGSMTRGRPGGRLDDDILGRGTGDLAPRVDPYFKQIFDQ